MPYTPKNDAERGILASWGELETDVTNHDPNGWSPHFLDEFVLISSGGSRIWVKHDGMWRMALSYQTTIQAAPAIVPPGASPSTR